MTSNQALFFFFPTTFPTVVMLSISALNDGVYFQKVQSLAIVKNLALII
jgi:hypothetical protein